jgi:hypothetical protein
MQGILSSASVFKATVGNKHMQVGMKSHWKIPERLYGDKSEILNNMSQELVS